MTKLSRWRSWKWNLKEFQRVRGSLWNKISQGEIALFVFEIWISSQNICKRSRPSHVGSLGLVLGQRSKKQNFRVEFSRNKNISVHGWMHWMTVFEVKHFLVLGKCLLPWPKSFISNPENENRFQSLASYRTVTCSSWPLVDSIGRKHKVGACSLNAGPYRLDCSTSRLAEPCLD